MRDTGFRIQDLVYEHNAMEFGVNCFNFKTIHGEHQDDMSWQLLAQGSES